MCSSKSVDSLSQTREEYGNTALLESELCPDPFEQFKVWYDQHAQTEPNTHNAMVLSTVDEHNHPDSRVVLLKELKDGQFVFYTQYTSNKGQQMAGNAFVALNFYWSYQARQVRVRGQVLRLNTIQSDEYFHTRPRESQLASIASHQSTPILDRDTLEAMYQDAVTEYHNQMIPRPEFWGGYAVVPSQIEFWQGRDNRLHDRIIYTRYEEQWQIQRLAP